MNVSVFAVFGYMLSGLVSALLIYFWRRTLFLQNAMQEKRRQEDLIKENEKNLQYKIDEIRQDLKYKNKDIEKLQKDLSEVQGNFQTLSDQHRDLEESSFQKEQRLDNDLEHYKSQASVLLEQLKEIDDEKAKISEELKKMESKFQSQERELLKKSKKDIESIESKNRQFGDERKRFEQTIAKLQSRVNEIDFDEVKKVRKKILQYQHFYNTIKTQREMLEERNKNWEVALKLLSQWILKNQLSSSHHHIPDNLGELVSSALEATKQGYLIDDEYTEKRAEKLVAGQVS